MASANKRRVDRTIGSVVAHPLRARCLTALADRTASPAELAIEFRKPLSDVSYHVATLLKAGAIELVGERPVRGSIQHFYRAIAMPYVDTAENADLPLDERLEFARLITQLAAADATIALDARTFNQRPDAHVVRMPMVVDEDGWKELAELYAEMVDRLFAVRAASDQRRAERGSAEDSSDDDGDGEIPLTAFVTFFERPPR
ncbi:MAG: helix-turn-helix domain-containing protein [Solirubrobacterales bacterium]